MPQGNAFDFLIGIFLIFTLGIQIFSGSIIASNAILNLAWTVGVPFSVVFLVFRAGGLLR